MEITEKTLRKDYAFVAFRLSEILMASPISKPEKHEGDKFTDYFLTNLPASEVEIIVEVFTDLEADAVEKDGTTTSSAGFYAEMADKWTNYLANLDS